MTRRRLLALVGLQPSGRQAEVMLNQVPTWFQGTYLQLPQTPAGGAAVYRNGLRQKPGLDYELHGQFITPSSAWAEDDVILVDYWR